MFKRFLALLWSRMMIILANKTAAINLILPFVMVLLYRYMFGRQMSGDELAYAVLWTSLPMVAPMIATVFPTIVSEEAEKNNQRSLLLAGVKPWEYVLSSLLFPFCIIFVYIVGLPFYLGISRSELGLSYLLVMALTALVTSLLFLMVSLLCETQSRATIVSLPLMMVSAFLPMFTMMDERVSDVIQWTFLGAFTELSSTGGRDYMLLSQSFGVLVVWLGLTIVGAVVVTSRRRLRRS